jgi:hypothetical protein
MSSKFEQLVSLHIKHDTAKAKVAEVKEKINEVEQEVLREMAELGLMQAKTPKGNLRISRIVRASAGGDMPGLVAAMVGAGKGDMVNETVNGSALGAWVREFDPGNSLSPEQIRKKLPASLQDAIKITEQIDIRVTRSKS